MCLILIARNKHHQYKLIIAANRDEFYARQSEQVNYWQDYPFILAGKDLSAGGTWMGITKAGKFCAITNYRDLKNVKSNAPSRGEVVLNYLRGSESAVEYSEILTNRGEMYNGFNLIYGTVDELFYYSNQSNQVEKLENSIYGLSNHFMDTPWHKNIRAKTKFAELISENKLSENFFIDLLTDDCLANDDELPETGVGKEWEKILSPIFIKSEVYGTRCSTIIKVTYDNQVEFTEVTHDSITIGNNRVSYNFKIE